jgi:hypothetical protein
MGKGEKKESKFRKVKDDTLSIVRRTHKTLTEGLTGILSSKPQEWILSAGYLLQRTRAIDFLETFLKEWEKYREKGRIPDDYLKTEQHKECLLEILDYLDKALPDEITFSVLKKIFIVASTEKISTRDSLLPQHYIRIIRKLSPGAILILTTAYIVAKEGITKEQTSNREARLWLIKIAERSGLIYIELVENYEEELIKYNLITDRQHTDRSGIFYGNHNRLTELGLNLCIYIENYEDLAE